MKNRLIGIFDLLQAVQDRDAIRDTGDTLFKAAKSELQDAINTYAEPVTPEPVTITQELDGRILTVLQNISGRIDGFEESMVVVMDHIVGPTPAPAPEPTPA